MLDLRKAIEPKSDQLNYDDLIAGPKTLKITAVKHGSAEQPIVISYEDDNGRPYKPCKSMLRILVTAWGNDGDKFVGRTMRVYGDDSVRWAGTEVGGIRISHLSDIEKTMRMMITISRGKKAPFVVEPLITKPKNALTDEQYTAFSTKLEEACDMDTLSGVGKEIKAGNFDDAGAKKLKAKYSEESKRVRGLDK